MLLDLGIYATKSVWVFDGNNKESKYYGSNSLVDQNYLEFVVWLQNNNFEIAFHNASYDSSKRETTKQALETYKRLLGDYPNIHVNHDENLENIYWGGSRLNLFPFKFLMKLFRSNYDFKGHDQNSLYFWGDLCKKHITYVRNFVYNEINLLKINPTLPYKDPKRPFGNYWFSSCDGGTYDSFNTLLSSKNQDRLENESGICIVYTHFGNDFCQNGKINSKTRELLKELAARDGWYVPVTTLLDYLRKNQLGKTRPLYEQINMETRWVLNKLMRGTT